MHSSSDLGSTFQPFYFNRLQIGLKLGAVDFVSEEDEPYRSLDGPEYRGRLTFSNFAQL